MIQAAKKVIAEKGVDKASITDITEEADVGIGSFYNHFKSKTDLAEMIFLRHADDLAKVNSAVFSAETDPALAIAYIHKIFLTKAIADPVWGWFVVHTTTDLPQMFKVFAKPAKEHLELAQSKGRFHIPDIDVAVRLILLGLTGGMRDILEGDAESKTGEFIIQSLLQMLGLDRDEAREMSQVTLPVYVTDLLGSISPSN